MVVFNLLCPIYLHSFAIILDLNLYTSAMDSLFSL
jgi:hypothetical protein